MGSTSPRENTTKPWPPERMLPRAAAALLLLLQPTSCLLVGLKPTSINTCSRARVATAAFPGKGLLTAAAGLLWWQRGRAAEKATDTLANMEWADAPDNLDEDGCVILGVEEGGEGRAWYKCSEPSEGLECEQNESLNVDGFVCKEPSPKAT